MKGCTGQCIAGAVVAIISGSLFLYTLVLGIQLQWTGASMSTSIMIYMLSLVFLAIAKLCKTHAHGCPHCKVNPPRKKRK